MMIGEVTSTFFLLFIGLGSGFLFKHIHSPWFAGGMWAIAVCVGSLTGQLLGSANMNPIFSLKDYLLGSISLTDCLLHLIGQVIGAFLAVTLLMMLLPKDATERTMLHKFAAVGKKEDTLTHTVLEVVGTFVLLYGAHIISHTTSHQLIKVLLTSLLVGLLIVLFGPLTGASFNPVRDLIPRAIWKHLPENQKQSALPSVISSNIGPLIACGVFILLSSILKI